MSTNPTQYRAEMVAEQIEEQIDYITEAKARDGALYLFTEPRGSGYTDALLFEALDAHDYHTTATKIVDGGSSVERLRITAIPHGDQA